MKNGRFKDCIEAAKRIQGWLKNQIRIDWPETKEGEQKQYNLLVIPRAHEWLPKALKKEVRARAYRCQIRTDRNLHLGSVVENNFPKAAQENPVGRKKVLHTYFANRLMGQERAIRTLYSYRKAICDLAPNIATPE